jgi:hypothetical protein
MVLADCWVTVLCTKEVHGLKVPRNLVYAMMELNENVDSSGLEERGGVMQPKQPVRAKRFISMA